MSLEEASAIVALVSAVAGVAVLLRGISERRRAFELQKEELKDQTERWRGELEAGRNREEVAAKMEFLLEHNRRRITVYGEVFKILGAVSDVTIVGKCVELHGDIQLLRSTAHSLYNHLYGEAGLLMTWKTRNYIHAARRACLTFLDSDGSQSDCRELSDAFFFARRYLRADLELWDDRTPENLDKMVEKLHESAVKT